MNHVISAIRRGAISILATAASLPLLLLGLGCDAREAPTTSGTGNVVEQIELRDGRVRLELSDAGTLGVLRKLADQGGFDLELHEFSPRSVTLHLEDATLAEAIGAIVGRSNFELEYAFDPNTAGHAVSVLHVGSSRSSDGPGFVTARKDSTGIDETRVPGSPSLQQTDSNATREPSSRDSIDAARDRIAPLRDAAERAEGERRAALADEYAEARDDLQAALRAALDDPDPRVREEALSEVKATEGDARERIARLAEKDPDPNIRLAAIEVLAEDGTFQAVTELVAMLDDPEPQVLVATLEALDFSGDESLAPHIEPLANHSDSQVREKAREMLEFWE